MEFFFTSSRSVDWYQTWIGIRKKYSYCHISNTPLFGGVFEQNARVFDY